MSSSLQIFQSNCIIYISTCQLVSKYFNPSQDYLSILFISLDQPRNMLLVIQKALTASDVHNQQSRFSIPANRMANKFLSADEEAFLDRKPDDERHYNRMIVDITEPSVK